MNRIIPIPNMSNLLIHPTVYIMDHIAFLTEKRKKKQKNVRNKNEHKPKKQPNIIF